MSSAHAQAQGRIGRLAVVLMVGLGASLALFGILHQRSQTLRCLRFLGAFAARQVTAAPHVELMRLTPTDREGRLVAVERWDISAARGLVHLRRGLVEDANYDWTGGSGNVPAAVAREDRVPAAAWQWGIAFAESAPATDANTATILAFALAGTARGEPGWMTVAGSPGRIRLGRIDRALSKWIEGFLAEHGSAGESVGLGRIGKEGERSP